MQSIWNFCKQVETVENENTNYTYYKAKLDIALKEIKAQNSQEKLILFNKIEKIKRSDIIKVYDYFDENDKIFILLEDDKEKMSNFNKYIYDEEEKTIKEIAIRNHGVPIQQTEITKLFQKGTESMCKIHILKNGKSGTGTGFFCSIRHSNLNLNVVLLTNNHILDEEFLKEGNIIEYESGNEIIKQIKITKERRFFTNKDLDYTCIEIFETDKILNYFEINDYYEWKYSKNY